MINEMLFLQSFAIGGFGDFFAQLEQLGFFTYLLPFLIIFSIVFGILSKIGIFRDNKTINGVIAIAVGLMALQFGFVSSFFSQIFPKLGIGLSVLLILLILIGFVASSSASIITISMAVIGVVIFAIIISNSFDYSASFSFLPWFSQNWTTVLVISFFVVIMWAVWSSLNPPANRYPWWQHLGEAAKGISGNPSP